MSLKACVGLANGFWDSCRPEDILSAITDGGFYCLAAPVFLSAAIALYKDCRGESHRELQLHELNNNTLAFDSALRM
ncbi:MAG: hypothetical protein P1U40_07955 [Coxiellaceae bacterium]|nr:hypothetical protein [Coxiellaceae bacterium]